MPLASSFALFFPFRLILTPFGGRLQSLPISVGLERGMVGLVGVGMARCLLLSRRKYVGGTRALFAKNIQVENVQSSVVNYSRSLVEGAPGRASLV